MKLRTEKAKFTLRIQMSALTCCRRLFADRQVGALGQTVQVPLQDVPAHLIVEGEPELGVNLEPGTEIHTPAS